MNKTGLKYSLICLGTGLSLWYASPRYFYEQMPHELIARMYKNGVSKEFWDDIHYNAFPAGVFTRPMTYVGLAGLVVSLILPKKKE